MSEGKEGSESASCIPQTLTQIVTQIQSNTNTVAVTHLSPQVETGHTNLTASKIPGGQASLNPSQIQQTTLVTNQIQMQAAPTQQALLPQASQVQQPQSATNAIPPQSPQQYYVHTSVGTGMQGPPAIAPAPGPGQQTTTTTTVSALHQPLMHHLAPQPLAHPGVSPSPMPQYSPQVQVIQSGIPGTPYLQQVYQNAQGQIIMPSNLTIQPAPGMGASPLQQGTINPLNSSIQVITAGKPFQGQITPHMLAGGKATGVIQQSQGGYSHQSIPSTLSQTVVIGQLGGPLGVISSQPPNILPAHSTTQKPGEMHKVNNMQQATAFGQIQPNSITWAAPGAAIQSPTLLTQNPPIFIRGSQPGQENLYIQSAPAQPMAAANNAVVQSITSMAPGPQQAKVRSAIDAQANIQPKVATMRPQILPSGAQLRPGASVSTQTAMAQQTIAPAHMVAPRSQVQKYFGKVRGKNANNRVAATVVSQTQAVQPQQQQQIVLQQPPGMTPMPQVIGGPPPSSGGYLPVVNGGISVQNGGSMPTLASIQKGMAPAPNMVQVDVSGSVAAAAMPAQQNQTGTLEPPQFVAPVQSLPQFPTPTALKVVATTKPSQHQPGSIQSIAPAPAPPSTVLSKLSNIVATVSCSVETGTTIAAVATSTLHVSSSSSSTFTSSSTYPSTPSSLSSSSSSSIPNNISSMPSSVSHANGLSDSASVATVVKTEVSDTTTLAPTSGSGNAGSLGPDVSSAENCIAWKAILPRSESLGVGLPNGNSPAVSLPPAQNGTGSDHEKETAPLTNGNHTPGDGGAAPPTSLPSGPPKAMVKPQVLTHVIEGFVIHEASEPFPVNRSSILSDMSKGRSNTPANTATVLPQGAHPRTGVNNESNSINEENDIKKESPGKAESTKCEVCGKTDSKSKYKKSKRFCSSACAKRFNVGCAKRVGLFKPLDESPGKKLKDDSEAVTENASENNDLGVGNAVCETNGNQTISELLGAPEGILDEEELAATPKVDILKWTVRDVVDFIQNLPGCQDYAEDFELQEIDGQALMLLKADHLMSAMSIKLGPALKICSKIEAMRSDRKEV